MKQTYHTWNNIFSVFDEIENIFETIPTYTWRYNTVAMPQAKEMENEYKITMLVAGLTKEDIDIEYKKCSNTSIPCISIEVKEGNDYVAKGSRTFALGRDADVTSTKATIENGVLTITVKKDESKIEVGKVTIN